MLSLCKNGLVWFFCILADHVCRIFPYILAQQTSTGNFQTFTCLPQNILSHFFKTVIRIHHLQNFGHCPAAVQLVFQRLYDQGLIYRGNRMVNWCPTCNTSISDAEVEYEEQDGHFWHLLYTVKETGEQLELATTRPETMLGDTAVAINGDDPRYAHLHGCHVILPLLNKEIPIVCDEHADMEKGTGVVKITPAHDPNDFEVGERHDLPRVRVFTYDGRMTGPEDKAAADELFRTGKAAAGEPEVLDCGKYAGMTTLEARKAILADLKEGGVELLLNPYIRDKMTTEQQEKYDAALQMVEEMRAKIISGEVVVERNIEKR